MHGRDGFWYDFYYDTLVRRGSGPSYQLADRVRVLVQILDDQQSGLNMMAGVGNQFVYTVESELMRDRVTAELIFSPGRSLWFFDDPTIVLAPGVNLVDTDRQYQVFVELVLATRFDIWRSP